MDPTIGSARLRKKELFAALGYTPHEGQVLVHRSKAPRRVLCCGVRWGKSKCAAMECVAALCDLREQSLGWVVAPNFDVSQLIIDQVADALEAHLKHRIVVLDRREQRIVVRNFGGGLSELKGKSAEQPASLLGAGIDYVIVDEAARLKREVWFGFVSQRLIDRKGWALLMSTPRGVNWFRSVFKRGQNGRDPDYESWSSPSWANPHLDRALIEAERARLPEGNFMQEYAGEFVGIDQEPCDRCGWPDPMACTVKVIENEDEEMPTCADCGGMVNAEGRTMEGRDTNGHRYFTKIILAPRIDLPPLLPIEEPGGAPLPPQAPQDVGIVEYWRK